MEKRKSNTSVDTSEGQEMNMQDRKYPPQAVFIIIGISLMVIGITVNVAFLGAGALFMIIGLTAVAKHKKALGEMSESENVQPPSSKPKE